MHGAPHDRRLSKLARALGASALLLSACVPESIFDDLPSDAEAGEPGDDRPGLEADRPQFIDPPGGTLSIRADHSETIELRVQALRIGTTNLILDGQNLGTLSSANREGEFAGNHLRLSFSGSLTKGVHALNLYNPGDPVGATSAPVAIEVIPSQERTPQLQLDAPEQSGVLELHYDGIGTQARLVWITQASADVEPQVHLIANDAAASWLSDQATSFELPNYRPRARSWSRLALEVQDPDQGEARMHLAWLLQGSAASLGLMQLDAAGDPIEQVELAPDAFRAFAGEDLRLDAPELLDGFVLLALDAPRDTEQAAPGDRALIYASWPDSLVSDDSDLPPGSAATLNWQRLGTFPGSDLGPLGAWFDPRAPQSAGTSRVARVGGVRTRRVGSQAQLDALNLPEAIVRGPDPLPANTDYLTTIAGALGSRTTLVSAGVDSRINYEALFANRGESQALIGAPLPADAPSGPPAASCIEGRNVFALPYGDDAPVMLIISDGARGRVYTTELNCDQIVLARPELSSLDDESTPPTQVAVACLHAGELSFGSLGLLAP